MSGVFNELADDYVAMRRRLGYRMTGQATYLANFALFLDRSGHRGPVPASVSVTWAADTNSSDPRNPARRLAVIRGFLRHLAAPARLAALLRHLAAPARRLLGHLAAPARRAALLRHLKKVRKE